MGGYQQLVRGDVMRGKFRNSFEKPEPFEPGEPTKVEVHACRTSATRSARATGSWCRCRARWFPLVDRNPQTFVDIYNAKDDDFRKATHRVYRSAGRLSHLNLPVVRP